MIDLFFYNGRLLTIDTQQPRAEAVAVRDGKIFAVGSNDELASLRARATLAVDLDGATLMPGFIDAHTHFVSGSLTLDRVRLAGITTLAGMQRLVAEKAAATPKGQWIVGRGWDETKRADVVALPTKEDLDAVAPEHPVYLGRADGHVGWANSLALRMAGIDADRADPYGGRIVRDADGEPTGILQETAKMLDRGGL